MDLNILFAHSGNDLCFWDNSPDKLFTNASNSWLVTVRPKCSAENAIAAGRFRSWGNLVSFSLIDKRDEVPWLSLENRVWIIFSHRRLAALSVKPHIGAWWQKDTRNAERLVIDCPVTSLRRLKMTSLDWLSSASCRDSAMSNCCPSSASMPRKSSGDERKVSCFLDLLLLVKLLSSLGIIKLSRIAEADEEESSWSIESIIWFFFMDRDVRSDLDANGECPNAIMKRTDPKDHESQCGPVRSSAEDAFRPRCGMQHSRKSSSWLLAI